MTGKWKPKPKKVVETSLGKAPKDTPDLSHLRKPLQTSVSSLKQVLGLFQSATSEVKDYITYECDILYECKICRSIFRSLANFILHKRDYCREKFPPGGGGDLGDGGFVMSVTSDEDSRSATPIPEEVKKNDKKAISPVIEKLVEKQRINILVKDTVNEDLSGKNDSNEDDDVIFVSEGKSVVLEKIDSNKAAVFQTAVKNEENKEGFMKNEVLEIHGILENNQAILDPLGKISTTQLPKPSNPNIPKPELTCTECNYTFSTEKTLTHHIKYKHNKTCIVFPCPDCKETFSNAWSVYRHLYKVHRRTTSQVRRMRHLVHTSGIRKDQEPEKKKRKIVEENEENQWMNNFEGDHYLQMCGGCGKRFERKAALHSHSQMCTKRIAVCNSIKNVKVGKSEKKIDEGKSLKGAAKRKGLTPKNLTRIEEEIEDPLLIKENEVEGEPQTGNGILITNAPDVTITKDTPTTKIPPQSDKNSEIRFLPDIEIFTISDDSNECETLEKRKRMCELPKTSDISDEYKEYVNDDADNCFLSNASGYLDKNELKCIPCEMNFMSLYRLLRHMSLHYSWFRFQCSKCSFTSFHKYDCTTHAHTQHGTPSHLMESTVLPIPKWKVLCTSHDFKQLVTKMPELKKIDENNDETIILEDDDMPDITESVPFQEEVVLSDEEGKNDKKNVKPGPSQTVVSSRPIRNRTKSVKTVQNDFIYDLGKVFKYHDSVKNKKKKSLNKV